MSETLNAAPETGALPGPQKPAASDTHFDDLNTYALLDLLVGLLESEVEQRQFIISTCDEKLLQLARQKFRHFGGRAKYYQFNSIGADGPSVDEIL